MPKPDIKNFDCCGGNDETPKEHTQDCEEFGNPEWIAELEHFEKTGRGWSKQERNDWKKVQGKH